MLYLLLSPLSLDVLIALALALVWKWLPGGLRYAGIFIVILPLVAMTPLGANTLVRLVESRAPSRACAAEPPMTIVVLSGGFQREPLSATDFSAENSQSLDRLFAGAALWKRTPGAHLVIAGGGDGAIAESEVMARLAEQLGVPAQAIGTERRSHSTWENAQNLAALKPPLPARITLVSSALHLPRALIAFRAAGFQPCAWSSGSMYLPPGGLGYFVPQSSSLLKTEAAIHELAGAAYYAWRARHAAPVRTP